MNVLVKKPHTPFGTEFTRFMDSVIKEFPISNGGSTVRTPVNIVENENDFIVEIQAPGWEKGDFSIKVENDVLLISANNTVENIEETPATQTTTEEDKPKARFIKKEFSRHSFKRSFTLSNKVNKDEINAEYINGILKVTIAKSEAAKPISKVVEVA